MNDVLKKQIEEFAQYQKSLIEKTKMHLQEAKDEYLKLMDLANTKDFQIEQLENNNQNQKNVIQSYEERVLSIVVLEYKIKNLDTENQKKVEKMKKQYENTVQKLKKSQNFVIAPCSNESTLSKKMKEVNERLQESKTRQLEKDIEFIKNKMNTLIQSHNKESQEKDKEIQKLKESLNQLQKQNCYHFQETFPKSILI